MSAVRRVQSPSERHGLKITQGPAAATCAWRAFRMRSARLDTDRSSAFAELSKLLGDNVLAFRRHPLIQPRQSDQRIPHGGRGRGRSHFAIVIPILTDNHPCAHLRRPMDMIVQG